MENQLREAQCQHDEIGRDTKVHDEDLPRVEALDEGRGLPVGDETEREVRDGAGHVGVLREAVLRGAERQVESERHKLAVQGIGGVGQVERDNVQTRTVILRRGQSLQVLLTRTYRGESVAGRQTSQDETVGRVLHAVPEQFADSHAAAVENELHLFGAARLRERHGHGAERHLLAQIELTQRHERDGNFSAVAVKDGHAIRHVERALFEVDECGHAVADLRDLHDLRQDQLGAARVASSAATTATCQLIEDVAHLTESVDTCQLDCDSFTAATVLTGRECST